jgi:hypothetical protein
VSFLILSLFFLSADRVFRAYQASRHERGFYCSRNASSVTKKARARHERESEFSSEGGHARSAFEGSDHKRKVDQTLKCRAENFAVSRE